MGYIFVKLITIQEYPTRLSSKKWSWCSRTSSLLIGLTRGPHAEMGLAKTKYELE